MIPWKLPQKLAHASAPPLKSQGIKTKLLPLIAQSIRWNPGGDGRWVEPFLGTGAVVLNLAPPRALLCDLNPHTIRLLQDIQDGALSAASAREYLQDEGGVLSREGESHYYKIRDRFNLSPNSHDFLFLNRTSFNGIVRFNKKGFFNTPFCHKPERFDASFLTRVANQINWAARQMHGKDWQFACQDWRETYSAVREDDFVYLDPPYIGRNADYFSQWSDSDAVELAQRTQQLPCGYALSMWIKNSYRTNTHVDEMWPDHTVRLASHFYHVGSTESLRNEMIEGVLCKQGFGIESDEIFATKRRHREEQSSLFG